MLALSLLVEFLGTAFFLSVILSTARFGAKQPILIGTALAALAGGLALGGGAH